jgi:uncharacterized protein YhhL (DUF1145 family)
MWLTMNSANPRTGRFSVDVILTLAGMTGIAVLFLPFYHSTGFLFGGDESPLSVVRALLARPGDNFLWFIALYAAPFFLSVLVTGASLRLLISGTLARAEKWLAYVAAAVMACATAFVIINLVAFGLSARPLTWEILPLLPAAAVLVVGARLVIRNSRLRARRAINALTTLQVAYLTNCVLCLAVFFPALGTGAMLAVVTAAAYATDIILSSTSSRHGPHAASVGTQAGQAPGAKPRR